ncbi:MAG: hypothetical protein ACSNEK_10385 [Parachlamydiaceae bacterium]
MEQAVLNTHFESEAETPQHIQFEIIEEEILAINRPTVQLYEQV